MIIGVIASLTIPSLIQSTEKHELETSLKKTYSELAQALDRMRTDEFVIKNAYPARTFYQKYMKYFNVVKDCGYTNCSFMWDYGDGALSIKDYKTYNKKQNVSTYYFDDGQFVTANGLYIMIENPAVATDSPENKIFITVDINGMKKKPNAWGHDLFTFELVDGEVLPIGAAGTNKNGLTLPCDKDSSSPLNGIGCTQKALTDPDYWKNLP